MHGLHYRAIDENGRVHSGYSNNASISELERWIAQRGWQPLPTSVWQQIGNGLRLGPRDARWTQSSAAMFTLNFSQLLLAGVPLLQALKELVELESQHGVRRALLSIHELVDQGSNLSKAMSTCPGLFGQDYLASVKAGERSGKLAQCLKQQAANLQWQANLSQRFKTVLAYPLFALVCLIAVVLFVLLYLVPSMLPLLNMNSAPLPLHTRWLLNISEMLLAGGVFGVLVTGCLLVLVGLLFVAETPVKVRIQQLLLRGTYGKIITHFSLARYARNTSLLYESGVEITDAMQISQSLINNTLIKNQLTRAHQSVLSGDNIGAAMQAQNGLPVLFVRMIIAGERSGVLGVALRQCADQLQANAQYSLDKIERLIGPVLLCIMGALLLWVAISVLGPIYGVVSQAGALI